MAKILMKGNQAIALAAVNAGLDAFFGYPITPQNEVPEYLSKYLNERGKIFVQAESEVAAINMVYGAAGAGARVMTSSSSVGIALKQEGISYIAGAELPALIVSVMRAGPGLGGISPSQADYFQATRGGGNGDYHVVVLAPESIQETVDLIKQGFDIADQYRNPVMVLVDGLIGQMMESVDMDKPVKKRHIEPKTYATTGTKNHEGRNIINSLGLDPYYLEQHNYHLRDKYNEIIKHETQVELINMEKADYVIVAYGTMARISRSAIETLKEKGINVGMIRPITLWPYPKKAFDLIPKDCKGILVTEMSMGQMVDDVMISNKGRHKIAFYGRPGGIVPEPEEIVDAILNYEKVGGGRMIKYERSKGLTDVNTHYCPGCTHGILHKLVAEVLEELNVLDHTVGIASVGCSVFSYEYFNCDFQQAPHGRACALATGVKRVLPDNVVFTYQGDGDLASIGIAETIHAANRGENITVIMANNATYGMTGGQMAPTTLLGQKATTAQDGRNTIQHGNPMHVSEMFATIDRAAYVERVALTDIGNIRKAKKAIKKAFTYQIEKKGFTLIEVVSTCPVNWGMKPREALDWAKEHMIPIYPLGVYKDIEKMIRTIRIAGFGGQGVMLTGQLMAHAANKQGLYSLWVPTYGPETRGGTANCSIVVSDKPIYSPVFSKSDDLLVFNEPSLTKFGDKVKPGGNLFYNKSLIKGDVEGNDHHIYGIPMNDIAKELDVPQVANMVMLGAYLKKVDIFKEEVIMESLKYFLGEKKVDLLPVNQKALARGFESI